MTQKGIVLLVAAIGFLVIAAGCMILSLTATRRLKRLDDRIDQIVRPHAQARSVRSAGLISRTTPSRPGFSQHLTRWLLYDPAKGDRYRIPFPVVLLLSMGAGIACCLIVRSVFRPLAWPSCPVAALLTCRSIYRWHDQKIRRVLFDQFPDALGMIVRSVRVGVPVSEAISIVAREAMDPTAREFGRVAEQVAIGSTMEEALRNMAERNSLPEYSFFAVTLSLQSQTGGGLTETLEGLAETVRKRAAARDRGSALAAEAKMSMYILAALPPCSGAILFIVNAPYIMLLFERQTGEKILAFACILWCVGMFSMRTLIRKSLS